MLPRSHVNISLSLNKRISLAHLIAVVFVALLLDPQVEAPYGVVFAAAEERVRLVRNCCNLVSRALVAAELVVACLGRSEQV